MIKNSNLENTFPIDAKDLIIEYCNKIGIDYMKNCINNYPYSKTAMIEKIFKENNFQDLYSKLFSMFQINKEKFQCFHSTRVADESLILQNGIFINEWEVYCKSLIDQFKILDIPENEIKKVVEKVKIEHDRKYSYQNFPKVCFYSSYNVFANDYRIFSDSIGGEVLQYALEDDLYLYNKIIGKGKPIVVEFAIDIEDMERKEAVMLQYIYWVVLEYLYNEKYVVQYDSYMARNVDPKEIINIYEWKDE